ncbi:transmembrane protein 136 [Selaginella moellendorffii]|uniref:transmembrane protein 136 n=1 Tax=Selaginella moellendorffii TaxID=88036 RepID=UPI000D1CDE08|nr:transmembrane protein 136 [Selaginella moellendorffii]|eukprot:XP_024520732.1 transmembrane protein 136 [Selaginella moellendorffii]
MATAITGTTMELAVGVALWSSLFTAVRFILFPSRSHDFSNRIVSLVHAFVALALCTLSLHDWRHPFQPLASPASPAQVRAITVSLAYFIYDFFCCLLEVPFDAATALHHLVSIMGLCYGFLYKVSGTELVGCLWLMEMSNPCMHAREILKELGVKDRPLNLWNDLSFAITFTIARMGFGPYLTFITLRANNPLTVKLGASGIQIVSVFWFYKIARLVRYKLKKQVKSS